jgi:hypothetical protein
MHEGCDARIDDGPHTPHTTDRGEELKRGECASREQDIRAFLVRPGLDLFFGFLKGVVKRSGPTLGPLHKIGVSVPRSDERVDDRRMACSNPQADCTPKQPILGSGQTVAGLHKPTKRAWVLLPELVRLDFDAKLDLTSGLTPNQKENPQNNTTQRECSKFNRERPTVDCGP